MVGGAPGRALAGVGQAGVDRDQHGTPGVAGGDQAQGQPGPERVADDQVGGGGGCGQRGDGVVPGARDRPTRVAGQGDRVDWQLRWPVVEDGRP
jgi:hypothetical protein